ncbi:hypothetical protein Q765_17440 [Flavobacterium rivuli WB 3.3-2 = DSM 21788]|uniref:Uncharacterized protein n=1 Tax=Flavobacterium rivuli WB 3.3-2 = DSM 21788 TaxID=1121895 RepID=A0A0A2M157_9FLAO|nr:hypothetical protein [Flavobacterium rivuli]KGO85153.1 hypothetical protein Q765_17440 [Flavobacterium rivuli WB 3.3-2 = DSM 21788]
MKSKITIILILCFLNSYKSVGQFHYDKSEFKKEFEIERSESKFHLSLCIIFENSMIGDKIFLQEVTSEEIVFNDILNEKINSVFGKIIFITNNPDSYIFNVNNNLLHIEEYIYERYRYLVVKKIEGKLTLVYTNEYPGYTFTELTKLDRK